MEFKQVENISLSEKIVEEILNMMKTGVLKPGDKLPNEMELAQQFGVSRGILRESLALLKSQGYITRKPKDGTYITDQLTTEQISGNMLKTMKIASYRDLIEMREAFEQKAVELAIKKASDQDIEELAELLDSNPDIKDEARTDYYFHYRLAELSGNTVFMNFIDMYYDLIREIADNTFKDEGRKAEVIREHRNIVEAIRHRNVQAAVHAVVHHLDMVGKRISAE